MLGNPLRRGNSGVGVVALRRESVAICHCGGTIRDVVALGGQQHCQQRSFTLNSEVSALAIGQLWLGSLLSTALVWFQSARISVALPKYGVFAQYRNLRQRLWDAKATGTQSARLVSARTHWRMSRVPLNFGGGPASIRLRSPRHCARRTRQVRRFHVREHSSSSNPGNGS
jgi:hypothetical protein